MKVDILLDPFGARWADVRDAASAAIDAGFAGIWTFDHLDGRVYDAPSVLECWTVLSALAVSVPDVTLGPLVLNVGNRHPGLLATMAATLQEVSGGRLLLGLGAGGGGQDSRYRLEQEAVGRTVAPDPTRRAQVEACVEEVRRLWHTPGFLAPDPDPPVVIGALGPRMAEIAGRIGDGLNVRATHPRVGELVEVARDAHARSGRDPGRFLATVYAEFDEGWLMSESPGRAELATIGAARLILRMAYPYELRRIVDAGRSLTG